jgi:D-inositol-3-phosphate glycosyltransferase
MGERISVETRPLNIAMLSVHSCPVGELGTKDTGGMSVYIRELARELGMRGHFVDAYTRFHDLRDSQIIELGENTRLIHIKAGENGHMPKMDIYPHLSDFTSSLEEFRKRDGRDYDLVHSHYWLSGRVGRWVQRLWGVPHIMMFHTLGEVKKAIGVGDDEPKLRLATEKGLVENCDRIIAATEGEKKELIQYYNAVPETIGVVPCGVNLELFKPVDKKYARQQLDLDREENIVLYVGRIDPLKGIDRLLLARAYLQNKKEFKLIVIGDNNNLQPELQRLTWMSQNLGIQDSVIFAGRVEQEDLPLYYSAADVFVLPSYCESFGLVALESLACGTPVVATKVGGIESIIHEGQNGHLVKGDVPRSIANKIALLLSNPRDCVNSPDAIRESVTDYCWANVADALIEEYRAMLTGQVAQMACATSTSRC